MTFDLKDCHARLTAENTALYEELRKFGPVSDFRSSIAAFSRIAETIEALNSTAFAATWGPSLGKLLPRRKQPDIEAWAESLVDEFLAKGCAGFLKAAPRDGKTRNEVSARLVEVGKKCLLPNILAWILAPTTLRYRNLVVQLCRYGDAVKGSAFMALKMPETLTDYQYTLLQDSKLEADRVFAITAELLLSAAADSGQKLALASNLFHKNAAALNSLGKLYPAWLFTTSLTTLAAQKEQALKDSELKREGLERENGDLKTALRASAIDAETWRKCYESAKQDQSGKGFKAG